MSAVDHGNVRPATPTTYYEDLVRVPGFGVERASGVVEAPERCRGLSPVGFCENGHTVLGRSSCGTRYCPDHWRDWCEDAVVSMVARLAAYRHAVEGAEKRLSHVVASPPQDRRYSVREMWDTRTDAYEALRAAGVRGGAVVTHPYRTTDEADEMYATVARNGDLDEDTGKWRFLRDLVEDWDELDELVEAAPHYHTLAAGEDIQGEAAPGDWVVERIRTFKPFYYQDTEAYRDMVGAAYYVLTHGAVQDGRSTTTYFGEVHPATFNPEEELTAAVWDRIQLEAEKAVKGAADEEDGAGGAGPDECPHEGCEAAVVDVIYLEEYLDNEEWVASIRAGRHGRDRWLRLKGMLLWWNQMTDRPPPSARRCERRMREWLQERGETVTPGRRQVGLETAVMG